MATAHHNLPGSLVQQILETAPPLAEQFYDPELISLLPMDFYYPGKGAHGDNPPRKDFAPKWHPQLLELMPDVQLILLVGAYSQKHYLDGVHAPKAQKNLTETVRAWESYLPKFLPLVHSSPAT